MKKGPKYYVVWEGRNPGIYESWDQCKKEIEGVDGARYKSFTSPELAEKAFLGDYRKYIGKDERRLKFEQQPESSWLKPDKNSLAVDASCLGNPGILEYRGVDMQTGREIFRAGPFEEGTQNIGEFLAIVHALALLKGKGSNLNIYSDSLTAISWVRQKRAKTKLTPTPANRTLFELLDRAEKWLNTNTWENTITKWPSDLWGEIPADFGRK